jgi:cytidylate kinase
LRISIAIDGPAGAGKSTIAKILSKKLNLMYINTGAMYRAVTLRALEKNIDTNDTQSLCNIIDGMEMKFINDNLYVNGIDINNEITMPIISKNVSKYASILQVREKLVKVQQEMSNKYDVIMDGRDIGTVVLKDAPFKFFVTATPEERARRRFEELTNKNIECNYDEILKDIIQRDYKDSHREIDPLKMAQDAIEVDTTSMNIEEVVDYIYKYVNNSLNKII